MTRSPSGETEARQTPSKQGAFGWGLAFRGLLIACAASLALLLAAYAVASLMEGESPFQSGTPGLVFVLLGLLLLVVSLVVAFAAGRAVDEDIGFLAEGVQLMVRRGVFDAPVPMRSLDEVGDLTRWFDRLRAHYSAVLRRHREARIEAEEADRYKSEFLTAVSHELRTPLNAILGFTEILLSESEGPLTEAQREDLLIVQQAGERLTELFTDVLDLAAASSGRLSLARAETDVGAVAREVAMVSRGQVVGRPVEVRLEMSSELPTVFADRRRVHQVLANLVGNALKFTEEGEVVIGARATERELVIEVRDTGVGISEDQLTRIFEEFGQAEDEERRGRGLGLGLAIVRQLVELHGGRVEVESAFGKGSVFRVILPRVREESAP